MKESRFKSALEKYDEIVGAAFEELENEFMECVIKPFCNHYKWEYSASMGQMAFRDRNNYFVFEKPDKIATIFFELQYRVNTHWGENYDPKIGGDPSNGRHYTGDPGSMFKSEQAKKGSKV